MAIAQKKLLGESLVEKALLLKNNSDRRNSRPEQMQSPCGKFLLKKA